MLIKYATMKQRNVLDIPDIRDSVERVFTLSVATNLIRGPICLKGHQKSMHNSLEDPNVKAM